MPGIEPGTNTSGSFERLILFPWDQLVAVLGSDFSEAASVERRVAQVVVEHGTLPMADLYFELKPLSRNLGAVDYKALIRRENPILTRNPEGQFDLLRIGDAVASRNIHAGIYDALRYGVLF